MNRCIIKEKAPPFIPKVIGRNIMSLKAANTLTISMIKNIVNLFSKKIGKFDGTDRIIELFYASILSNQAVPVSPEEGVFSMEFMDEIWKQIGPLRS